MPPLTTCLLAALLALLCAPAARAAAPPPCFGAAARDPEHQPCNNPALRLSVEPSVEDAVIVPSAPCEPVESETTPQVCWFGTPKDKAKLTFALIGDSHAVHWRAAMTVVAKAKGWYGLSIDHSRCPFTMARTALPGSVGRFCTNWRKQTMEWLRRHPEVSMVVVSQNSGAAIRAPKGQNNLEAKIAGYANAWSALPPSIQRIFVLHDVPHVRTSTAPCIGRALKQRRSPGKACALLRATSLAPDAAFTAAQRLANPRFTPIDLTDFMCDEKLCYPVVGGVLVHRDIGHMTRTFSETLGPYLLRAMDQVGA